jgi:DNA mismatch repair protein MSH3
MRKWVTAPLKRGSDILKRLEAVEAIIQMIDTPSIITSVIKLLEDLSIDLERCLGRISHKTICPRDLISCLAAFRDICKVLNGDSGTVDGKTFLDSIKSDFLQHLLQDCTDQKAAKFANNVIASLNIQACEENDIINVYNDDMKYSSVAQRRKQLEDSKVAIDNLRPSLAKDLGFSSVEYVSIQNQGEYLIEVPISKENLVPPSWEKISSTKQMMRFLPPTVAEHIQQVDLAREYLGIVANESWKDLLEDVGMYLHEFHNIVKALSSLDCLISFAALSRRQGYVKPKIIDDDLAEPFYEVRDGRHPILEVTNNEHRFVPNDVHLGGRRAICQVITGPNMGGKSVYIKQGALIAFMAQIGCFVPASYCALRPFDAIFTRMGAADSIALGRSTFLEEVSEASQILVDASARSLVIIDELGRGTSSQDGQSIALATIKHLISVVGCAILFVTHYPEIAIESCSSRLIMERACPYFMGYITDTEESKIIFTYKLTEGVADSSYGLNVAHMAGVPENVTEKAESIASYIHKQIQSSSSKAMFRKLMRILNERETLSKENILDLQRQVQSRI